MSNKSDRALNKRVTLKDIEEHLKRQDLGTIGAVFIAGILWGFSLVILAISLWFAREGIGPKELSNTFLIMHTVGWLIAIYCWIRWSMVRRTFRKQIKEDNKSTHR